MQTLGPDYAAGGESGGVECGLLVGVLAVAQVGGAVVSEGEFGPGGVAGVGGEVAGDGGVVEGDVLERLAGEFAPLVHAEGVGRETIVSDTLGYPAVIGGVNYDQDEREVLGGGADHGRTADVNVLKSVLEGDVVRADGLDEGVEIAGNYVYGLDAVRVELGAVGVEVAAGEDAAVYDGMEGLDATVEHLGRAGEVGDLCHGESGVGDVTRRAACGDKFASGVGERAGEVGDSCLVVNAE